VKAGADHNDCQKSNQNHFMTVPLAAWVFFIPDFDAARVPAGRTTTAGRMP
jgi:hypothetical protein